MTAEKPPVRDGNRINVGYYQSQVLRSNARFITLVAGRRFGKTTLLAIRQFMRAVNKRESLNWYIAPTYRQAKEIMWEPLKALIPREYMARKPNESELKIVLKNRSVIMLKGSDNPDSLRGPGLWTADFDEFSEQEERAFSEVVRAALADNQGSALFAGTPKGYNHFYDYHLRALDPNKYPDWAQFSFTTAHGGYVTLEEQRAAKDDLDPRVYRQEFKASFETLAGRVYDNFERAKHFEKVEDMEREVYIGLDFNINPMSAVVVQRVLGKPQVLACYQLMTSNTEEMAKFLMSKWGKDSLGKKRKVYVCPDASGTARHTSSPQGQTDFTILEKHGMIIVANKSNPQVVDRINNVQSNLLSGDGRVNLRIHPTRCLPLVKTLEGLTWKEGTNLPDKKSGLDHMGDALGYVLWQEFNLLEKALPRVAPAVTPMFSPFEV